jgi:hypothetical protein
MKRLEEIEPFLSSDYSKDDIELSLHNLEQAFNILIKINNKNTNDRFSTSKNTNQ